MREVHAFESVSTMAERKRYLKRKQIVFINFEVLEYKDLLDYKKTILIYYGSPAG